MRIAVLLVVSWLYSGFLGAEEPPQKSAEQIAKDTRLALVAISHTSRPGGGDREGTGFFVGEHLIATNLHVIGDARAIESSIWPSFESRRGGPTYFR